MKQKLLTLCVLSLVFLTTTQAGIFRVNSSLASNVSQRLYQTINDAVNAASSGDTLMIEGSPLPYANATLTKPLVLIGPGYFLTQNPQTQANGAPATVQKIEINANAGGSVLEGLTFSSNSYSYTPYIETNNVVISRCYCSNAIEIVGNISNISIFQNYFTNSAIDVSSYSYSFTNVVFRNNFVGGNVSVSSSNENPRIFSAVENNILGSSVTLTTTTFRSNIITSTNSLSITSGNVQNNLTAGGQLTGNGNQTYVSSSLFVGATGNSTDGQYKLQSNSPYLTAGYNGTQPGLFGGTQPYVLSGIPPVPSIYEFTADEAANKQTGLPVSIKVKTNQ